MKYLDSIEIVQLQYCYNATWVLCMMQGVIGISSSVQVDDVSQLGTCVMETTTAETAPMNRTV